jgi:hypothetical protein
MTFANDRIELETDLRRICNIAKDDGHPIDPGPEAVDALLDVWPILGAFQLT